MKRKLIFLFVAFVAMILLQAQTPDVLNYQGILKDQDGGVLPDQDAVLTIEFLQSETVVYSETHYIRTNANGYFSIHPGEGESIVGDFGDIDWGASAVVMRSILDGTTIAETSLTSVPYALYAHRVKGQEDMKYSIDSIGDAHYQTALQVDSNLSVLLDLYRNTDSVRQDVVVVQTGLSDALVYIDSLRIEFDRSVSQIEEHAVAISDLQKIADTTFVVIDSISVLLDSMQYDLSTVQSDIDTLQYAVTKLCETDSLSALLADTLGHEIDSLSFQIDSLSKEVPFFNATAYAPLSGAYHTHETACRVVPQQLRRSGLVVTYKCDTLNWRSIQFVHNDTAQWCNRAAWSSYGYIGNLTLPYAENDSSTRLQIPEEYRRQGLVITYFNNEGLVNEQYIVSKYDDMTWSNDSSWLQLLLPGRELDKMKAEIARMDTLMSDMKKELQDMTTFGAWFYIEHKEYFTQVGAVDYEGNETEDLSMVHTHLIPVNDNWLVTAYGNSTYPAISFYASQDLQSRLPSVCDTLTSETWQEQTIDFSLDYIPVSAQYFSVNMLLEKKSKIAVKERTPITDVIDTSIEYNYKEVQNSFTYIGAYVGCDGRRVINSDYRHSRFIAIDDNVYKIYSGGSYNETRVTPVVVYYSNSGFGYAVGYDIGDVNNEGNTTRELIISRETAPENANYFVVNWCPAHLTSVVSQGTKIDEAVNDATERLSFIEENMSCYSNRKLVTLGDSFTTNSGNRGKHWQQWLADWLGLNWSVEETKNGLYGYSPMGYGGSWITPNDINSMSIRCQDVRRYSPNIIILYGGQNDQIAPDKLGSIDDEPFIYSNLIDLTGGATTTIQGAVENMVVEGVNVIDKTLLHIMTEHGKKLYYIADSQNWQNPENWYVARDSVSFYSAYKGILEHLCKRNPYATVYCMTLMQCDSTRYDQSLGAWEDLHALRLAKNEAIKEIAAYYGVQVIDLWNKSGVTPYNAASLYSDFLHPNQYGYRRMAECIYREFK